MKVRLDMRVPWWPKVKLMAWLRGVERRRKKLIRVCFPIFAMGKRVCSPMFAVGKKVRLKLKFKMVPKVRLGNCRLLFKI